MPQGVESNGVAAAVDKQKARVRLHVGEPHLFKGAHDLVKAARVRRLDPDSDVKLRRLLLPHDTVAFISRRSPV